MALLLEIGKEETALVEARQGLTSIHLRASALTVETAEDLPVAAETISIAHVLGKKLEEERKRVVKPLQDATKDINARYKELADALDSIERGVKGKSEAYNRAQAIEAEKKRKREEEERRAIEEEKAAEDRASGVEESLGLPPWERPREPELPSTIKTSLGSIGTRKSWRFSVEDEKLVPREFLAIDEKKIREAIRLGVRAIAGVKIFQEEEVVNQ